VNLHNAEVRAFFAPEEGNAFYNAIDYDPTPAMGAPTARPPYYALLLFARFAQGTRGLRPVALAPPSPVADPTAAAPVKAWQLDTGPNARRLFVANLGSTPQTVAVPSRQERYAINRMSPYDPTGAGRTLDAPEVRIDGRSVAADGRWPGFAPTRGRIAKGRVALTLGAGEVAVLTLRGV
jgi:hypothetical protein